MFEYELEIHETLLVISFFFVIHVLVFNSWLEQVHTTPNYRFELIRV